MMTASGLGVGASTSFNVFVSWWSNGWSAFDQKLGLDVVRPTSVVVEGDVAAVAGGAEGFVQEFGRTDSATRIAALGRDGNCLVIRLREAGCEENLAAWMPRSTA